MQAQFNMLQLNFIGAVMSLLASDGGAGTGEAARTAASAALSSSGEPEERDRVTEETFPASSMEKRT